LFQEFASTRERLNRSLIALKRCGMSILKFLSEFWSHAMADLTAESLDQQTATHADAAMNSPNGQGETRLFKSLVPRENMLIDTVDERAVKIKKQSWGVIDLLIHWVGDPETTSLLLSFLISAMLSWYSSNDEIMEEIRRAVSVFFFKYSVYASEIGRSFF
jgi:hypothetical protein